MINFVEQHSIVRFNKPTTKDPDKLQRIEERRNRLDNMLFKKFWTMYNVVKDTSPFSTQHNTKGAEFDHVLVVVDNKTWNKRYHFESMLCSNSDPSVADDTQNLFYVVCSRAKKNLAVLYLSSVSDKTVQGMKRLFNDQVDLQKHL